MRSSSRNLFFKTTRKWKIHLHFDITLPTHSLTISFYPPHLPPYNTMLPSPSTPLHYQVTLPIYPLHYHVTLPIYPLQYHVTLPTYHVTKICYPSHLPPYNTMLPSPLTPLQYCVTFPIHPLTILCYLPHPPPYNIMLPSPSTLPYHVKHITNFPTILSFSTFPQSTDTFHVVFNSIKYIWENNCHKETDYRSCPSLQLSNVVEGAKPGRELCT